jgi:diguanylate cyclase (GGDEF)-like protein
VTEAQESSAPVGRFRGRLVASLVFAALVPFAAAYWIAESYVVDQEHRAADTRLAFTLQTAAAEWGDILGETRDRARRLAQTPAVTSALRKRDAHTLRKLLGDRESAVLASGRRVGPVIRGAPVARVAVRTSRGPLGTIEVAAPAPSELLRRIRKGTPFARGDLLVLAHDDKVAVGPVAFHGARLTGHRVKIDGRSFAHLEAAVPGYLPPIRLVALADQADADRAVDRLQRRLAFVGLSSLAAIILCAAALARPLLRGFDRVADVAQQAEIDPLTKVANRRGFERSLRIELARTARHGRTCSLVLADLDDFKRVNDAYGHEAGDAVLVAFASRLRESVRASDLVARLGGEEFAVVLGEIDLDGALVLAERIRRRLTDEPIGRAGTVTLRVTASFGVAEASTATDWSALLRRADAALYVAKGAGKNRVSGTSTPGWQASGSLHAPPAPS